MCYLMSSVVMGIDERRWASNDSLIYLCMVKIILKLKINIYEIMTKRVI